MYFSNKFHFNINHTFLISKLHIFIQNTTNQLFNTKYSVVFFLFLFALTTIHSQKNLNNPCYTDSYWELLRENKSKPQIF